MHKRLSLFIVCLLLFSSLLTAYHHHDGGQNHSDCPICAVAGQHAATLPTLPGFIAPKQLSTTIEFFPCTTQLISITRFSLHSRAPPA